MLEIMEPNLALVVCGTALGERSAERAEFYAGEGNKFWSTLAAVGLTDRQLVPSEYRRLLEFGIGLTDLVQDQAGVDATIAFERSDSLRLRDSIERYQPRILCFNGKRAAKEFFGAKSVTYGFQEAQIRRTEIFVAPSTSAMANASWDEAIWHRLAERVRQYRGAASR
jgi:TDG/mug DNA glycosylase family protein